MGTTRGSEDGRSRRSGKIASLLRAATRRILGGSGRYGAMAVAGIALAVSAGCASSPAPQKPIIHTTKAFDAIFGALPPMTVPGPCYATVVFFPSVREPGKYLPVPIFSAEQGKEEMLAVRTAVRGVDAPGLSAEATPLFPAGSELESFAYDAGVAKIRIGGAFRAETTSPGLGERAAGALALTVAQFGKTASVDVTDTAGKVHFTGRADSATTADVGPPKSLGLLAIREDKGHAPSVLSVLFDRPVSVDEIAIYPRDSQSSVPGKAYATGFGMSVELHPEPAVAFDANSAYRVRIAVRDGKGRKWSGEKVMHPKDVTRE